PIVRCAHPMPAEFTSTRSGPIDFAISTASTMSSVRVTSTLAKAPPISDAISVPRSSCRSATTTLAPRPASLRAVAAPMPDAPPVTIALTPLMSMGADVTWHARAHWNQAAGSVGWDRAETDARVEDASGYPALHVGVEPSGEVDDDVGLL